MLVNKVLKTVAPHVPVVGSAYGFVKTCIYRRIKKNNKISQISALWVRF